MRNDILIITDSIVNPPTDSFAFRSVTMISHDEFNMDVLIHTTQSMKDVYYKWMKVRGMMDYISYLLNEKENEDGIKIDVTYKTSNTIVTQSIKFDNQLSIIGQISSFCQNKWLNNF